MQYLIKNNNVGKIEYIYPFIRWTLAAWFGITVVDIISTDLSDILTTTESQVKAISAILMPVIYIVIYFVNRPHKQKMKELDLKEKELEIQLKKKELLDINKLAEKRLLELKSAMIKEEMQNEYTPLRKYLESEGISPEEAGKIIVKHKTKKS